MSTNPWVSAENVVENQSIAKDSVYRWIETRGLPAHRIVRLWKFKISEIDQCVREGEATHDEVKESKE